MDIIIYIIYHNDASYELIKQYEKYPYVKLIHIETTKFFESIIFRYLANHKNEWISKKYVGLLTYAFGRKINMTLDTLYTNLVKLLNNDYDLITLFQGGGKYYDKPLTYNFHPNNQKIFDYVLPKVGFKTPIRYDLVHGFYCNYWITKSVWMEKYIDFALTVMDILSDAKDIYLQKLVNGSARYRAGNLTQAQLIKMFNLPHYPNHPFIMERLPSLFFWDQGFVKIGNSKTGFGLYRKTSP